MTPSWNSQILPPQRRAFDANREQRGLLRRRSAVNGSLYSAKSVMMHQTHAYSAKNESVPVNLCFTPCCKSSCFQASLDSITQPLGAFSCRATHSISDFGPAGDNVRNLWALEDRAVDPLDRVKLLSKDRDVVISANNRVQGVDSIPRIERRMGILAREDARRV